MDKVDYIKHVLRNPSNISQTELACQYLDDISRGIDKLEAEVARLKSNQSDCIGKEVEANPRMNDSEYNFYGR